MNKYTDAHCHMPTNTLPATGNVVKWICNATRMSDWNAVAQMAAGDSRVFGAIGLHPWYLSDVPQNWPNVMAQMLAWYPALGVGEIGLDSTRPDVDTQSDIFTAQLSVAAQYRRTVHVHCVRAWDMLLRILKSEKTPPAVVLHGFNGRPEMIRDLLRRANVYFSYSPRVLCTDSVRIRECVAATPCDRILAESDAGMDESHVIIPGVIDKLAKVRGVDTNAMTDMIYDNIMGVINIWHD